MSAALFDVEAIVSLGRMKKSATAFEGHHPPLPFSLPVSVISVVCPSVTAHMSGNTGQDDGGKVGEHSGLGRQAKCHTAEPAVAPPFLTQNGLPTTNHGVIG